MMAFWDIFIGKKTAEKALDIADKATTGIIAGIDKLWFTEEERSEASKEITKAHIELMKALSNENTARSVTRRYLAIMFCGSFLYLLLFSAMIWFWSKDWAAHVLLCAEALGSIVLAITIFYFGYYGVKQLIKKTNS